MNGAIEEVAIVMLLLPVVEVGFEGARRRSDVVAAKKGCSKQTGLVWAWRIVVSPETTLSVEVFLNIDPARAVISRVILETSSLLDVLSR